MLFYRTLAKEKKFFESPCSFFCGIKQLGSPFFLEQEPKALISNLSVFKFAFSTSRNGVEFLRIKIFIFLSSRGSLA